MAKKFKMKKPKRDQIYYMCFDSGYREYFSIGKDLRIMADNLLKRYNRYCITDHKVYSLEEMAAIASTNEWHFNSYIVEINSASDMDYRDFGNEFYMGDYLQKVRDDNEKHLSE